jgi:hypothetical protein
VVETPAGTETTSQSVVEAENLVRFTEMGITVGFDFPEGIEQSTNTSVQPVYVNYGPTELPYPQHARILFTAYTGGSEDFTASGIRVFRAEEVNALEAGILDEFAAVMEGQFDHHIDFPRVNGVAFNVDAKLSLVPFKNGNGYRFMFTTSGFVPQPLGSTTLTLMYQGLSSDEKYYVSFIIPINAPFLSEFLNQPNEMTSEEFTAHYQAVNARIETAAPEEFTPSLNAVDEMIHSIIVMEE